MKFEIWGRLKSFVGDDDPVWNAKFLNAGVYKVIWEDGELTAVRPFDQTAVDRVKAMASILSGESIGPEAGPWREFNYLEDGLSAFFLMHDHVFGIIEKVRGDNPAPALPKNTDESIFIDGTSR